MPLTTLPKKKKFFWTKKAQQAFNQLKEAMMNTLVLQLPNFTNAFVVECDALGEGLGAILMQEG